MDTPWCINNLAPQLWATIAAYVAAPCLLQYPVPADPEQQPTREWDWSSTSLSHSNPLNKRAGCDRQPLCNLSLEVSSHNSWSWWSLIDGVTAMFVSYPGRQSILILFRSGSDNRVTIYCFSNRNWKHIYFSSSERFCGTDPHLKKDLIRFLYYVYYYYCSGTALLSPIRGREDKQTPKNCLLHPSSYQLICHAWGLINSSVFDGRIHHSL